MRPFSLEAVVVTAAAEAEGSVVEVLLPIIDSDSFLIVPAFDPFLTSPFATV